MQVPPFADELQSQRVFRTEEYYRQGQTLAKQGKRRGAILLRNVALRLGDRRMQEAARGLFGQIAPDNIVNGA